MNLKASRTGLVEILFYFFKLLNDFSSLMIKFRYILTLSAMISNRIKQTLTFQIKIYSLFELFSFNSEKIVYKFCLDFVKFLCNASCLHHLRTLSWKFTNMEA